MELIKKSQFSCPLCDAKAFSRKFHTTAGGNSTRDFDRSSKPDSERHASQHTASHRPKRLAQRVKRPRSSWPRWAGLAQGGIKWIGAAKCSCNLSPSPASISHRPSIQWALAYLHFLAQDNAMSAADFWTWQGYKWARNNKVLFERKMPRKFQRQFSVYSAIMRCGGE